MDSFTQTPPPPQLSPRPQHPKSACPPPAHHLSNTPAAPAPASLRLRAARMPLGAAIPLSQEGANEFGPSAQSPLRCAVSACVSVAFACLLRDVRCCVEFARGCVVLHRMLASRLLGLGSDRAEWRKSMW
eukprot:GFKZ01000558.1.p1 GENE.GFKZ01000558.1~~GFKZ01000558.1.p1  ORF type:complete len:130 (-),score=9.22 GFKZ01000558.1:358-747(-)